MSVRDPDVLARLDTLRGKLADLRSRYADQPAVYNVYSQSLLYEVELLEGQIRSHLGTDDSRVDVWFQLAGSAFGFGSGRMEVVAHFLTNLRIAAKHAASALRGVTNTGGRFLGEIEAATSFELIATAPGSLQIGLTRATSILHEQFPRDLFEHDVMRSVISETTDRQDLGIEAIRILLLALEAAQSDEALGELRSRLDDHGTLRVLYHARSLFPRGLDDLTIRGRAIGGTRRFPSEIKEKLRSVGERLVQAERYVSGVGVMRMLDLDRRTLRIEFARIDDLAEIDTLAAEYTQEVEPVSPLLGKPIAFAGSLSFDVRGIPQRVRLDSLEPLEAPSDDASRKPAYLF